jgi:hypothetical protein
VSIMATTTSTLPVVTSQALKALIAAGTSLR